MTCAEFQEILHDLDRPGTGGLAKREIALAHAEWCGSCGRLLTEAEALDFGLRTLALHDESKRAPLHVEAALLREFHQHRTASKRMGTRWYAVAIGVAALALLAVGLLRFRTTILPGSASQPSVTTGNATLANPAAHGDSSAVAESNGLNQLASSEEATDFVLLPYADDASSFEGGAVIRVTMPRSTLASWGLPVSGAAGTDRIPADLLVSDDGVPQAIRLISQTSD